MDIRAPRFRIERTYYEYDIKNGNLVENMFSL